MIKQKLEKLLLEYSNSQFKVRELDQQDYDKGFMNLLEQLTIAPKVDIKLFIKTLEQIKQDNNSYLIVIEDLKTQKIAAAGTILIEKKFIRNLGKCGHIEDIVVDKNYRGNNLGQSVVEALNRIGFELENCYKVTLDCAVRNIEFYKKLNFQVHSNHMSLYREKFFDKFTQPIKAKL